VTVSATSLTPALTATPTTLLGVLADASATAAQMHSEVEISQVNSAIQNRLNAQVAALQTTPDTAVVNALQTQITALQKQSSLYSNVGSQFGANANILSDLQNQLATMQTAASGGDGTTFDTALAAANNDVGDLNIIAPTAPFQPDQVITLQANGLGISNSATYDLGSPAGQAAAAAAVQSAQTLVNQVFQATGSNQILAGSLNTELSTQTTALNAQLQQMQQSDSAATADQVQRLTQQAQDQEHLIELAIGNTQLLSTALMNAATPPQPASSVMEVLQNAVGATASSVLSKQSTPPILSLLT
jgi:hypothetical protein